MSGRLGAVGTLIQDRIEHPSRPPVEQLGGAIYSLAALSAACPSGWSIHPIMKVGSDVWSRAGSILRTLPRVDPSPGLVRVPEPNNRVHLRYHDPERRCETLTGGVPPWRPDELRPLLQRLDALYVNFVSGMEMDVESAALVRRELDGFIYCDLHSLFLGPPGDGPRPARPLPDWPRWLRCFDAVQMNEEELALLGIPLAELPTLLEHGPSMVLVTRGRRGAAYAVRDPVGRGSRTRIGEVPLPGGALEGDPTGCGDVWGATLFAARLGGAPLETAIVRAHRAAAIKIREPRTDRLHAALASSEPHPPVLP